MPFFVVRNPSCSWCYGRLLDWLLRSTTPTIQWSRRGAGSINLIKMRTTSYGCVGTPDGPRENLWECATPSKYSFSFAGDSWGRRVGPFSHVCVKDNPGDPSPTQGYVPISKLNHPLHHWVLHQCTFANSLLLGNAPLRDWIRSTIQILKFKTYQSHITHTTSFVRT